MTDRNGLLIVNEGPDGSGKATQTALLGKRLRAEGFTVQTYSFPTYAEDPVAGLIRSLLRERPADWRSLPWQVKATFYACNRLRFLEQLSSWLQEQGTVVVCDRYVPSNQAHLAGHAADARLWEARFRWIEHLEYDVMGLPRPDIVLLHTMPRATADALLTRRGVKDAHEKDGAYLDRVERCYRVLAQRDHARWLHVPADLAGVVQSAEDVHARVWAAGQRHPAWKAFAHERVAVRS